MEYKQFVSRFLIIDHCNTISLYWAGKPPYNGNQHNDGKTIVKPLEIQQMFNKDLN